MTTEADKISVSEVKKEERSWTNEQKTAIDVRDKTLLVSAAAGSGKTAVLTERIIKTLTVGENPPSVSELLVVTFTKAAAAEMRERIGKAIKKAAEAEPTNTHLQRQLMLLPSARKVLILLLDSILTSSYTVPPPAGFLAMEVVGT